MLLRTLSTMSCGTAAIDPDCADLLADQIGQLLQGRQRGGCQLARAHIRFDIAHADRRTAPRLAVYLANVADA